MSAKTRPNAGVVALQPVRRWALATRAVASKALPLALLGGFAVLLFCSMLDESPTTDEPPHLTCGLAYFWAPNTSLSIPHPPLASAFAALPIVLHERALDLGSMPRWADKDPFRLAEAIFVSSYEERRSWFFEARAMIALLTLAFAVYVYRWMTGVFGAATGLVALFMLVTHPTLIAHGRLVTNDMALTAAMIIGLCELLSYLRGGSRWHGICAALLTGAAPVIKYSGILQIPIALCIVGAAALVRFGRYRDRPGWEIVRSCTAYLGLSAVVCVLVINAAYRFEDTGWTVERIVSSPEPSFERTPNHEHDRIERYSPVASWPKWLPVPLPYTFLIGVAMQREHAEVGHLTAFFGEIRRFGHRAYFPVMLLIKSPLLCLAGLACALWSAARRRFRVRFESFALVFFGFAFLAAATQVRINIGVRHVLPIVAVSTLLAAVGLVAVWNELAVRGRAAARAFAGLALAAHVLGLGWYYPDYVSDFNVLVGGRSGGERISIVGEEWDQDFVRLGRIARERGIRELHFATNLPTVSLELARFDVRMLPYDCSARLERGAYVAVSARALARDQAGCWSWTRSLTPVASVHAHLLVFRDERAAQ